MRKVFFIISVFLSPFFLFSDDVNTDDTNESALSSLQDAITLKSSGQNFIGYLKIKKDRAIDQSTFIYVKFALEEFKRQKVQFILLDLDTPGGDIFAAQKIAKALQDIDFYDRIPVICYIDDWAVSAGAMLAYSSRFIIAKKGSVMGASEPVVSHSMERASEKVVSALRSEFYNLAVFYDRNPYIAEAMVDKELILVKREGKIMTLNEPSEIKEGDIVLSAKNKLLTLDSDKLKEYGIATFVLSQIKDESSKVRWENPSLQLLFKSSFFSSIVNPELVKYKDWKITFFAILSHPFIMSLLLIGVIIGFYIELSTPGFGFAGSLGLVCLAFILLSSFSIYTINWLEPLILFIGILLLFIEVFITPGFGIVGVFGIVLATIGLFVVMLPSLSQVEFSFLTGARNLVSINFFKILLWLCSSFIVAFVSIVLLAKYFMPHLHLFQKFVLKNDKKASLGELSKTKLPPIPPVGTEAFVLTVLKPYGKILIDDDTYDAYAEMGFIDKGKRVMIIKIEKNRLIVREML